MTEPGSTGPQRRPTTQSVGRRSWWKTWVLAISCLVLGGLLAIVTVYVIIVRSKPDLEPWHRADLADAEFHAADEAETQDLAGYLEREQHLFQELDETVSGWSDRIGSLSRFSPGAPSDPKGFEPNWNRTFVLEPEQGPGGAKGGALLIHGLSDSPYSWRPLGTSMAEHGMRVVGLRVPGHGTLPGAIRATSWTDWQAAVRLAARDLAARLGEDELFVLGGYSNGGALAIDYTLQALEDPELRVPDRLVFLSPAFSVTRMAALARWQLLTCSLPGLEKMAWNSVIPEYDPFKYNSFALNAGNQIYKLTSSIEEGLARLETAGEMHRMPPILTLMSVIDSTVPPIDSLHRLYGRLEDNGSAIVLFDVNRVSEMEMFLSGAIDTLLDAIRRRDVYPFDITLVTNSHDRSLQVSALHRKAGETLNHAEALDLTWPYGVYSLSHVAVPFPSDDPVYGVAEQMRGPLPMGRLEPRGEKSALLVPSSLLLRLRYNPFFSYVERRTLEFLSLVEPGEPESQEPAAPEPAPPASQ